MTTNEAAERLLDQLLREYRMTDADKRAMVKAALAAERRATVERIRAELARDDLLTEPGQFINGAAIFSILDEEAAR